MKEYIDFSAPAKAPQRSQENWKTSLRDALRDPDELVDTLGLPESLRPGAHAAARQFPLVVPRSFLARMQPGDTSDPLLRQVLPISSETGAHAGFVRDPLDEAGATQQPGFLQKYRGRALLVVTGVCAVHCRYCFRRHFPYETSPRGIDAWRPALSTIAQDPTLNEVILSGGDPLILSDAPLRALVDAIGRITHIRRLRFHTRLPVVLPDRVTLELTDTLRTTRPDAVVVIHANHPAELERDCAAAIERLRTTGALLLNQAVLLRGVNDDVDTLAHLSERLLELGVLPYYLHQLDRVAGAAHFQVDEEVGRRLTLELRERLSGYAVPRYVRETPGATSKVPLV